MKRHLKIGDSWGKVYPLKFLLKMWQSNSPRLLIISLHPYIVDLSSKSSV